MASAQSTARRKRYDLSGCRFGLLTALGIVDTQQHSQSRWRCRCDCGAEKVVWRSSLVSGETKSCGCGWLRNPTRKHGHDQRRKRSGVYQTWASMIKRTTNPNYVEWRYYGGRGIHVCDRWRVFANFLADMGDRPEGMSIDRVNVNGDYCPENCRWATPKEQRANRRTASDCSVPFGF